MTQLAPHFSLAEMTVTSTGLANVPTSQHLGFLTFTATRMEVVRKLLGNKPITVNSAYRSPKVNKAVGGVPNSAHALGWAVDFVCPAFGTPYEICQAIIASEIKFDQLIHEKRRWVHISFDPRNRGQVLTYTLAGKYLHGLHS